MQRGEIFQVSRVWAGIEPVLYSLIDLKGDAVPGRFYRQVLRPAPNGKDPNFNFEIEQVLDSRGTGSNKEYLVKFMFYPDKFNEWIPAKNITGKV